MAGTKGFAFFHMTSQEMQGPRVVSGAPQRQGSKSTSHLFSRPIPQDYKMAAAAPCMINLHVKTKAERIFLLDVLSSERKIFP